MTNWIRFHDKLIISCWYIFFWRDERMGRQTNISISRPKKMIDDTKRWFGKIRQIDVKLCFFAQAITVILFSLLHINRKLFVSTRRYCKYNWVFSHSIRYRVGSQQPLYCFLTIKNVVQYHKEIEMMRKKKLMLQRDWNGEESERENCVWTKVSVTLKTAHRKKADVLLSSLNKTLKPGRQQGSTSGHSKNFNQTKSAQNNCSDVQYKWVQTKPPQMHFGDKVFVSLFLNQAILERQECCLNSGS